MMRKKVELDSRSPRVRWIMKDEVWHVRAKRFIRRKDGKPFRFPIFVKA